MDGKRRRFDSITSRSKIKARQAQAMGGNDLPTFHSYVAMGCNHIVL